MATKHDVAQSTSPKVTVSVRVRQETLDAIDDIAASMRPVPTRSELIALAAEEYAERHAHPRPRR